VTGIDIIAVTGPAMDAHTTYDAPDTIQPEPCNCEFKSDGHLGFVLSAKSIAVVQSDESRDLPRER
jgi:hypothetical protein